MDLQQFRAILWLRWRLAINQFNKSGPMNAVLTILVACGLLATMVFVFFGSIFFGMYVLSRQSPLAQLLAWDSIAGIFLFIWIIGIVIELQRSQWIDLQRLIAFPISLSGVFLINYFVSHFTLSIAIGGSIVSGLIIGLIIAKGFMAAMLVLPVLGYLLFLTAWTYYLRGWLTSLMANARRKRTIIVFVTTAFILMAQLPNLFLHTQYPRFTNASTLSKMISPEILHIHKFVPPLWIGFSAMKLTEGNPWHCLLYAAVASAFAGLGLLLAYRATIRIYLGNSKKIPIRKPHPEIPVPTKPPSTFLQIKLPELSHEASAVAAASFRSMLRAPEVKMSLFSGVITIFVFGAVFFSRQVGSLFSPVHAQATQGVALFASTIIVTFFIFGLNPLFFNQFGYDREGFRTYLLAPLARKDILMGKNLALFPFVGSVGIILLGIAAVTLHFPLSIFCAGICQLISAFFIAVLIGNIFSIFTPYRMNSGTLRPTKMPTSTVLLSFAGIFLLFLTFLPIYLPPVLQMLNQRFHVLPPFPLSLIGSLFLTVLLVVAYIFCVRGQGAWLDAREQKILQTVISEVE